MAAVRPASSQNRLQQLQASCWSARFVPEQVMSQATRWPAKLPPKQKAKQTQPQGQQAKPMQLETQMPQLGPVKQQPILPGSRRVRVQFDLRSVSFCRYWPDRVRYALFREAPADRKHNLAARSGARPIFGSY